MTETFTPPAELAPAADAAEAVLIWAEDAARRLLGRERPASAPELLQRVALGDVALRFTLSGPVNRCALLLQVVEAGHDGDRCRSVPVPDDLAAELPPVFLALLHLVGVARAGGRRPSGRLVALSQSVEAEGGAIVFRIDLRGALACMAATGPDGTMLMRAACLREGPGTDARPSIH